MKPARTRKPKQTACERGYVDADEAIKSLRSQIDALESDLAAIEGRPPLMKFSFQVWLASDDEVAK